MEHILNTLSPYTQLLLIVSIFWYAATQFCVDLARRRWRRKYREESARRESAEAGNRAKAFFLTSMSHEVRAPLDAMVGFTELAAKCPLNPELRAHLRTVTASAGWLTHIVEEIVEFSRLEAGLPQLTNDAFPLRETILSAIKMAQPKADQRKLTLHTRLDAALPGMVKGDCSRLLLLLSNLIDNAIKYTCAGSVLVCALIEKRNGDSVTFRISVADTGPGIPPAKMPYLFEPLKTPNLALDRRARSCGFGLPICQRVAQMMGSEIEVQSRAGIGSTFAFSLTLDLVPQANEIVLHQQVVQQPATEARKRLRILLADPVPATRRLAAASLQDDGHRVTEAATGLEAVKLFTAGNFELVFLDTEMPDLGGTETTKAIRATEPEGRSTPIYFLSKPMAVDTLLHLAAALAEANYNTARAASEAALFDRLLNPAPVSQDSVYSPPPKSNAIPRSVTIPALLQTLSPDVSLS